ncbi:CoA transferase [Geomonas sp. Red32]|uniref:CoA transferase n=1 Tax=Geomonas sp. Red32 TaxID=2912856 RepID=UPI00202CDCF7|nr:CaiB/BaiF CoA-transferase family protein [Geomonas sp. Red32]MCM0084202.1 CoA transferase [Geomonas sp. Red32]
MTNEANKPLSGLRVVNLALNLPGPAAAQRFRQLGAEVVKVEPPAGDPMRSYHEGWYRDMAEGQEVATIDLKGVDGRRELDALLEGADLLITANRPAALARLSLDFETLHRRFPRLCQVAIVGFPAPRENEAGHDLTYQANLGLIAPPQMPRTLMADMAGAEETISAALSLLLAREQGQGGGYAEVALSEAAARMAEPLRYGATAAGAVLGGGIPEYNIYQAREGWVAVAALEPHFKSRLDVELSATGAADYREAFLARSSQEWEAWAQERDIPIVAVAGA